jgi:hypothetical protein
MSVAILDGPPYISTPVFMLLEWDESLLQRIYQLEPDPQPYALFSGTELDAHLAQGPWLIQLASDSSVLSAYRQSPEQWPGVLLSSAQPVEELLAHLRQMLVVQFEGNRKGILRYYDPLVASYLFPATDAITSWLGPIEQLFWHSATWAERSENTSHWWNLRRDSAGPMVPKTGGLVLDKLQVAALERQELEAFAYQYWLKHSYACFSQVYGYLLQGLAAGFDEEQSLNPYLALRLAHPRHIHHPHIAAGQAQWRLQQLQAWLEATPAPSESQG